MSLSALVRTLPTCLSRTFTTTSVCAVSQEQSARPNPPRRKGRTPRVNPTTQSLLPPHKLRALVSLYHQSDDFITPENLLSRIDAAFINDIHEQYQSINRIRHEQFETVLKNQRAAPKMSPWDLDVPEPASTNPGGSRTWSDALARREAQIVEALYGVESAGHTVGPLPGYEALIEARRLMQSQKVQLVGEEEEVLPKRR